MDIGFFKRITLACALAAALAMTGCSKAHINYGKGASIIPVVSTGVTKGLVMTDATINHTGRQFGMQGYLDDTISTAEGDDVDPADKTNYHFLTDGILDYTGDNTTHSWDWDGVPATGSDEEKDAARPKWRAHITSRFWSYFPLGMESMGVSDLAWPGNTASNAEQAVVTFDYTQPDPAAAAPFEDAENQHDLLFAFNEQYYGSISDKTLRIRFHHALAAVNFDITTMGGTVEFGTEITIENVRYSGTCTATGIASDNSVGFAWSDLSDDTKSFSQSFDKAEDFETLGTEPDQYVKQKAGGEKTFFMVPQTLTADTKIAIKFIFKDGGVPITREVPIGKFNAEDSGYVSWAAGKVYTYRISVGGGDYSLIDSTLDVKDWVDGKKDISF